MLSSSKKTRGGLRFFSALMAIVLAIGMMPLPAFAAEGGGGTSSLSDALTAGTISADKGSDDAANGSTRGVIDTPSDTQGTVYVTYSHDGQFAPGQTDSGYMARVPVDLATLCEYEEASDYHYDANDDGVNDVTLYHLFAYCLENYDTSGRGISDWVVDNLGGGSAYMSRGAWHLDDGEGTPWDENLNYYFNGAYPLAGVGWGATLDQITLHDGDFADVAHFSDWNFWTSDEAGYQYFANPENTDSISAEFNAVAGEPFKIGLVRAYGNIMTGDGTEYIPIEGKVSYGASLVDYIGDFSSTDETGIYELTFAEPGKYVIWAPGTDFAAPAYATVEVSAPSVPAELQLSKLEFHTSRVITSDLYELEPAFDPAIKNYTMAIASNALSAGVVWATLADSATGSIQAVYTATNGSLQTKTITSGSDSGVALTSSIAGASIVGNTITIKVNEQEAYVINVVRQPVLNKLEVSANGESLSLEPKFASTTQEYELYLPSDAQIEVTPTITNATMASAVAIDVAGQEGSSAQATKVVPAWSNHAYDLVVTASGEGARDYAYTIHCVEKPNTLEIVNPPDKTVYDPGESFNPAGMQLKAAYAGGDERLVGPDDFTYAPEDPLKMGDGAITVSYGGMTVEQAIKINAPFEGSGTQEDPFIIKTSADYDAVKAIVNGGDALEGVYLKQAADIVLSDGWTPIGITKDGTNDIQKGANLNAFSGNLDGGGYIVIVPRDCPPLIGYVKNASISNLKVYGERIDGYGLVNNLEGVGLDGQAVIVDNVTILTGTNVVKSGILGGNITTNGFAAVSAGFVSTIRNCTVESGVVVGCDGNENYVGGVAGRLQGTIENCECNATVKGGSYVGGILALRDNSLGSVSVTGCTFGGSVEATGQHVGGIVGGGYPGSSAPNGVRTNIVGNTVTGSVTGGDKVGGILGGDTYVAQAWNAYEFKDNSFNGTVAATDEGAESIGGIIGFYKSLNKFDDITNNVYKSTCGAERGIGKVDFVDTNSATHETESGALYFNTETSTADCPSVSGCSWKTAHNRTDDPLGADADNLCKLIEEVHNWDGGTVTLPTFESDGSIVYKCTDEGCEATKTETIPAYGITVTAGGVEVPAADISITPNGYDASYEDWMAGNARVEDHIPLVTVTVPFGTESVGITLNDSFAEYQDYYYTAEPGESGYTEYVDYGFGDQVDQYTKVAYANKPYEGVALPAEGNVIRVQSAYDANYNSYNLYAIAFVVAPAPTIAKINLLAQIEKNTLAKVLPGFEVSSDDAAKYGYEKPKEFEGVVTMADAAAALHYEIYGEDFAADPTSYLKISSAGTCTLIFGEATYMNGFRVNDATPEYPDQPGTGSLWNDTPLSDGDNVRIFKVNGEYYGMMESFLIFDKSSYEAVDGAVDVTVTGELTFGTMMGMDSDVQPIEDATVYAVSDFAEPEGTKVAEAVTDEDGVAAFENLPDGNYHLVVVEYENEYGESCFSTPYAELSVHKWDGGTVTLPTFESDGSIVYKCETEGCEATKTETIPAYGFTVTVGDNDIPENYITIEPGAYDASYEDWMAGNARVEDHIPLVTVNVPYGTEAVKITLNDSFPEYQNYIYTAVPGESGYTEYVDYGFGDQVDQYNKVAYANKAYEGVALPAEGNVIRVQSAYDANYNSYNLYAIAFKADETVFNEAKANADQKAEAAATALAEAGTAAQAAQDAAAAVEEATDPVAKVEAAQVAVDKAQASVDAAQAAVAAADEAAQAAQAVSGLALTDEQKTTASDLATAAGAAQTQASQAKADAETAKANADSAKTAADAAQAEAFGAAKDAADQKAAAAANALTEAGAAAQAAKDAAAAVEAETDPVAKVNTAQLAVTAAQAAVDVAQAAVTAAAEALEAAQAANGLALTDEQKTAASELVAAAGNAQTQAAEAKSSADAAKQSADSTKASAETAQAEAFSTAKNTADQKAEAAAAALTEAGTAAQAAQGAAAAVEEATDPVAKVEAAQVAVDKAQASVDAAQAAVAAADEAAQAAQAVSGLALTDEQKTTASDLATASGAAQTQASQAKAAADTAKQSADNVKNEADTAQATAFDQAKQEAEKLAAEAATALAEAQAAEEAAKKAADVAAATTDPVAKVEAAQAAAEAAKTAAEKAKAAVEAAAKAAAAAKAVNDLAMTDDQKAAATEVTTAAENAQDKAAQAKTAADNTKKSADAAKKAADEGKKKADAAKVEVGKTYVVNGMTYKATALAGSANGTVTLVKAKNAKKVVVPAKVKLADGKYYNVDVIATKAFSNLKKLSKVTVGANVKKIQKSAFFKTPNLKNVVVKSKKLKKKASVKAAFKGSKVKKLTVKVPKKLKKAYKKSFAKKNIKAPKTVTVK